MQARSADFEPARARVQRAELDLPNGLCHERLPSAQRAVASLVSLEPPKRHSAGSRHFDYRACRVLSVIVAEQVDDYGPRSWPGREAEGRWRSWAPPPGGARAGPLLVQGNRGRLHIPQSRRHAAQPVRASGAGKAAVAVKRAPRY